MRHREQPPDNRTVKCQYDIFCHKFIRAAGAVPSEWSLPYWLIKDLCVVTCCLKQVLNPESVWFTRFINQTANKLLVSSVRFIQGTTGAIQYYLVLLKFAKFLVYWACAAPAEEIDWKKKNMAEDFDVEAMLEAPYRKDVSKQNTVTAGRFCCPHTIRQTPQNIRQNSSMGNPQLVVGLSSHVFFFLSIFNISKLVIYRS